MNKYVVWGVMTLFCVSPLFPAEGSVPVYTSMKVSLEGQKMDNLVAFPEITNRGDAPIRNIKVIVQVGNLYPYFFNNNGNLPVTKAELKVNETYNAGPIRGQVNFPKPGTYPVIAFIMFDDASGVKNGAEAFGLVSHNDNGQEGVISGAMPPISMGKQGDITATLKNAGATELKGTVRLFLPEELATPEQTKSFTVKAGEENTLTFQLKTNISQQGKNHAVLAVIDAEDSKHHYAAGVNSTITVTAEAQDNSGTGSNAWPKKALIIIIVALAVIGTLFIVLRKPATKEEKDQTGSE